MTEGKGALADLPRAADLGTGFLSKWPEFALLPVQVSAAVVED